MRKYVVLGILVILSMSAVVSAQLPTPIPGDLNEDGFVDHLDQMILMEHWHTGQKPIPTPTPFDNTVELPGGVTMEFVRIPAGSFLMGRYAGEQDSYDYEDPQHMVNIGNSFYLGKYEVTKAQWEAVMNTTPWAGQEEVLDEPDSPAVYVSWDDAQAFMTALNALGQGTFRLPSEAEWEYACRANNNMRFPWGDDASYSLLPFYAWYKGNAEEVGQNYAHRVGQKLHNSWDLYDMCGNVFEYCQDYAHDNYTEAPTDGSAWESPVSEGRMVRGGAYSAGPQFCRSAFRDVGRQDIGHRVVGFRVVRER